METLTNTQIELAADLLIDSLDAFYVTNDNTIRFEYNNSKYELKTLEEVIKFYIENIK